MQRNPNPDPDPNPNPNPSQADALYVVRDGYVLCQPKEAQRAQLEAKLVEWEATFRRTHEREPTAADKQRDRQHKELTKRIADLDRVIGAAESGLSPPGLSVAAGAEARAGAAARAQPTKLGTGALLGESALEAEAALRVLTLTLTLTLNP